MRYFMIILSPVQRDEMFVSALSRCDERDCHGLLRPNVVFFGETLDSHLLTMVEKEIETCDLCLVVSSPHDVYSSCVLILLCNLVFFFNLSRTWPEKHSFRERSDVDSGVVAPLLFTCRWGRLRLFTQQPCLAPGLQPEAFQWQSLTQIQLQKRSISCKLVKRSQFC